MCFHLVHTTCVDNSAVAYVSREKRPTFQHWPAVQHGSGAMEVAWSAADGERNGSCASTRSTPSSWGLPPVRNSDVWTTATGTMAWVSKRTTLNFTMCSPMTLAASTWTWTSSTTRTRPTTSWVMEHQLMEPFKFQDGRAWNGSCAFWVNCGNGSDIGMAENVTSRSRNGMCCGNRWIRTTSVSTVGIWNPNNFAEGIGAFFVMVGFAVIVRASLLVATWGSITSALMVTFLLFAFVVFIHGMDFGISYNHSSAWNDISPMFVQHGDEEQAGQNEIKKPLEPGTNQTQMAWWTQAKVECETAAERPYLYGIVHGGSGDGCAAGKRSSHKDHGAEQCSDSSCRYSNFDDWRGSTTRQRSFFQVWWWCEGPQTSWHLRGGRSCALQLVAWAVPELVGFLRFQEWWADQGRGKPWCDWAHGDFWASCERAECKLYSILSSYLRSPALQIARSCNEARDGFQALAAYADRLVIWAMSVPVVTTTSVRSTRTRQQLTSEGWSFTRLLHPQFPAPLKNGFQHAWSLT